MKLMSKLVVAAVVISGTAFAQNMPSSKATAAINTAVSCKVSNATSPDLATLPLTCTDIWTGNPVTVSATGFATVMSAPVKVSNSQSLFVSPSLVTGLYTETLVKTRTGSTSTAEAMGGVYLRAVLTTDAAGTNVVAIAAPVGACEDGILGCQKVGNDYGVVLNSRVQRLTQTLSECVVDVTVGGVSGSGTCTFDSTIDLLLKTTSAHTFNFIFPNVGQGTYYVHVQAALDSGATYVGSGTAVGSAAFGLGSMTIESVRLVHGFEF